MTSHTPLSRREALRLAGLAGAGVGLAGLASPLAAAAAKAPAPAGASMIGVPFEPRETVRFGLIGVGARGTSLLHDLLDVPGCRVTALCDIVEAQVTAARARIEEAGHEAPAAFTRGERDFENLCRRDDVDVVIIATPWDWHVPMALAAMNAGKHAAVEVPAATTIEDCWALVQASERTRRHCVMLENCCYGYNELLVLGLVRQGLLGEIVHAEAAYIHDLRKLLFSDESEGLWRREPHTRRDGNLYPTHGLGPVANYMGIQRGDRFEYLVSMSSLERGLSAYRQAHVDRASPKQLERYVCGDINTSLIRTAKGRTIVLQHDVVSPRPYDRLNLVSGTKGCFRDYPPRIFFDGQESHAWQELGELAKRHEDPLWTRLGEAARSHGHGGMDYVMLWRLVECLRRGLAPDMDVYDAAAWSAPTPLSQASVAQGSAPQPFPDFTRGRWIEPRA